MRQLLISVVIDCQIFSEPVLSKPTSVLPDELYVNNLYQILDQTQTSAMSCTKDCTIEAYRMHEICWQLLMLDTISPAILVDYGRCTADLYGLSRTAQGGESHSPPDRKYANAAHAHGSLTALLQVSYLPAEICSLILEYLEPSPFRTFLAMESVFTRYQLGVLRFASNSKNSTCNLEQTMTFCFRKIRGTSYLCGWGNTKQFVGHRGDVSREISLPQIINTMNFSIGPLGLTGLQFEGPESSSEWAGNEKDSRDPI